jgi:hypothetical protein
MYVPNKEEEKKNPLTYYIANGKELGVHIQAVAIPLVLPDQYPPQRDVRKDLSVQTKIFNNSQRI